MKEQEAALAEAETRALKRRPNIRAMTEADLQTMVIDLARLLRWRVVHIRNVPVAGQSGHVRYRVPYEGDPGLPDLIMARDGRVIMAELKSETGKLTAEQHAWLDAAGNSGYLWRPSHWPEIFQELA